MKKLVYLKAWRENEPPNIICVHKSNEEEVLNIFANFKFRISIENFNDGKSIALIKNDYSVPDTYFYYEVLNLLLQNCYELVEKVKSRFEWYKNRIEQDQLKRKPKEEPQTQNTQQYIWWCRENGCEITLNACKKCRFTNCGISCEPQRAVIEEKDGKEYVKIIRR